VEDRLRIPFILVCLRMRSVQESNLTFTHLFLSFTQLFYTNFIYSWSTSLEKKEAHISAYMDHYLFY